MKNTTAYLAAPYSHPEVRKWPLETVGQVCSELFKKGIWVFSPLTHNMTIDTRSIK